MDLRQLHAVVLVADTGSVTRAAQLLQLVQPAVTRQIRSLEKELGVTLFHRSPAGMQLTEAGAILVDRARRALTELERARAELVPEGTSVAGMVTVGLLDSLTDAIAQPLVRAMGREYPGIRLRLLTGYSGHLREWLDAGVVDVATLYDVTTSTSLHVRHLLDEHLWAVAPPGGWPDPKRPVPFAELARHHLIMPAPPHGLRTLIDSAGVTANAELTIRAEANTMRVQKQLVAAGMGWTVLPRIGVAREIADGALTGAPLTDPELLRSIVLARSRGTRVPAAVEIVTQELARRVVAVAAAHNESMHGGSTKPSARSARQTRDRAAHRRTRRGPRQHR
jgi:LysR family transcriptional regulator, nitrogen assimilation regulatory protein